MDGYPFFKTKQLLALAAFFSFLFTMEDAFSTEACSSLPELQAQAPSAVNLAEGAPDYIAINRILQLTDDAERRHRLRSQIKPVTVGNQTDAMALLPRLHIALAHSELRLGNPAAAVNALRQVPLESSQAASALVLLGEATRLAESADKAHTWILHAAQLYPHQPETVEGLMLAASWQNTPAKARPYLLQAKALASAQLGTVTTLLQRVKAPDFPHSLALNAPDPALWSLANEALTDPAFALAQQSHHQSLAFRDCLQAHMLAQATHRKKNPTLIRDLGQALQQLDALLPAMKNERQKIEAEFLNSARALKHCQQKSSDCDDLRQRRNRQGQELTQMRNRLQIMEQQRRFLMSEQQKLADRWQAEQRDMSALGLAILQKKSESRQIMAELLQKTLEKSRAQWQQLSARVHFQLAATQESLLGEKQGNNLNLP
jgi:hypothetical protein